MLVGQAASVKNAAISPGDTMACNAISTRTAIMPMQGHAVVRQTLRNGLPYRTDPRNRRLRNLHD